MQGQAASPDGPLVTALHDGRRRIVVAVDPLAAAIGLKPGMAVAQALAIVPRLLVAEADPEGDGAALLRLARWCHRTTPLACADAPDGLWLDITGCAHLWNGEAALLRALVDRLARDGLQARAAVADTPGAAHALARFGGAVVTVVTAGQQGAAIAPLPVACLRLSSELVATLRRLGFEQVAHLARIPRALLARRFGLLPGLRLDQAHGHVQEPLQPLLPEHVMQRRIAFLEPLSTAEALSAAIGRLVEPLCEEMEGAGLGARQLDLLFERVDSHVAAIRIGTSRPSRDPRHLLRLLTERLETVDPGFGVEAMRLVAPLIEPLQWEQQVSGEGAHRIAPLLDRLTNRLGAECLHSASPLESDIPERSVRRAPPFVTIQEQIIDSAAARNAISTIQRPEASLQPAPPHMSLVLCKPFEPAQGPVLASPVAHLRLVETTLVSNHDQSTGPEPPNLEPPSMAWQRPWALRQKSDGSKRTALPWPGQLHAPSRLLDPPRPIEAIAALPDQPPAAFTWRRHRHRISRSDGPERIHGEWWFHDDERQSVRDYFQVEDESGKRFLLFRRGNGLHVGTGDLSWYLHGLF
jgi:protein ImuB